MPPLALNKAQGGAAVDVKPHVLSGTLHNAIADAQLHVLNESVRSEAFDAQSSACGKALSSVAADAPPYVHSEAPRGAIAYAQPLFEEITSAYTDALNVLHFTAQVGAQDSAPVKELGAALLREGKGALVEAPCA